MNELPFAMIMAAAALALGACDEGASFRLHNATGGLLEVVPLEKVYIRRDIRLEPGESARIWRPGEWDLELKANGCLARYDVPDLPVNYPWYASDGQGPDHSYPYPIELQVERDMTLYLMPAAASGLMAVDVLKARQAHGFPWSPISKACR